MATSVKLNRKVAWSNLSYRRRLRHEKGSVIPARSASEWVLSAEETHSLALRAGIKKQKTTYMNTHQQRLWFPVDNQKNLQPVVCYLAPPPKTNSSCCFSRRRRDRI